jgi:F-type H+-transporting ATPase subunit b
MICSVVIAMCWLIAPAGAGLAPAADAPAGKAHAEADAGQGKAGGHGAADAHGEAHDENPLSGNYSQIIWTWVIFVVLAVVLGKFAWGPLLASLKQREDFIKDLVEKAERDRKAAAAAAAEHEQQLAQAKEEVRGIIEEGRRDADRLKQDIVAAAGKEADEIRARVRREIETARDQALKEIYDVAGRLAVDAAARILQRELKPEDHRRLVDEALRAYRKN